MREIILKYNEHEECWIDGYYNRYTKEVFKNYNEALKAAKSNKNCFYCEDCFECENCFECSDCNNCKNCVMCRDCELCKNCVITYISKECENCYQCEGCLRCYDCFECKLLHGGKSKDFIKKPKTP